MSAWEIFLQHAAAVLTSVPRQDFERFFVT